MEWKDLLSGNECGVTSTVQRVSVATNSCMCVQVCIPVVCCLFLEFTECLKICLTSEQCCSDTAAALGDTGTQQPKHHQSKRFQKYKALFLLRKHSIDMNEFFRGARTACCYSILKHSQVSFKSKRSINSDFTLLYSLESGKWASVCSRSSLPDGIP